jgi:hypothetical protein
MEYNPTISAAGTTYSPWMDISWANELYAYTDSAEVTSGTYSIVVTVERYLPYRTSAPVTVLTFTAITADATEEEYASALTYVTDVSADNQLGMRVRFKYVNTWTSGSTKVYSTIYAKRN